MTQSSNLYANFLPKALVGGIDLTSDTLKMALLGAGYTPDLDADVDFSDVRAHEIVGTGYTADGVTLTTPSVTLTTADSWGVTWGATTGYALSQVVIPSSPNGFLYRCAVAGVSGGSEPTWPTVVGETVTDGSVTWACMGADIVVFTTDAATWPGATFTTSYAVIYDAQSGTYSTEPLIVLETFAAPQSPSAQTYEVVPDSNLGWFYFSPPS